MGTRKNNIRLREKPLKNGTASLYLDIYRDGNRSYQFLKLYIIQKPSNIRERQLNKEIYALAEKIRTERENALNHETFGFIPEHKQRINILAFYQQYINHYQKKDIRMVKGSFTHFVKFLELNHPTLKSHIRPNQLTKIIIIGYKDYLESICKGEGARSLFQRFKKVLQFATDNDIFPKNPASGITCAVDESLKKDILSIPEIKILAQTHCPNNEVKRAFLFCLFSGIRFCDITTLTYKNIDFANKRMRFEQTKTQGRSSGSIVTIDLNQTLLEIIGEPQANEISIFQLPTHTACLKDLRKWVAQAGITKHITWHCARHSFAVNLLSECHTDVKTVAALLGHSGLKHVDKYTRIIDERKYEAINSLPKIEIS